ncbi:hypothetical protein [Cognatishimia sp. MH4019]|uniref:hypothetical protein n=1 Tax=Cognatishimia sp. MH4019 TaxID=2854030 RepID=UPI001CD60A49|nr:hypothetical protein [Cognatishimia sp. MH4019]
MACTKQDITIRSISEVTRARLDALRHHTRLTYGSLLDDAVEALWSEYEAEGHDVELEEPVAA